MLHTIRTKTSRFLGLGDVGELRARIDQIDRVVLEMNHSVADMMRRFDEMRGDLEAISAVSLGLERTSSELGSQLAAIERQAGAVPRMSH